MITRNRIMIVAPDTRELEKALATAEGIPVMAVEELPGTTPPFDVVAVLMPYAFFSKIDPLPTWTKRLAIAVYAADISWERRDEISRDNVFIITPDPLSKINLGTLYHCARNYLAISNERDHLQAAMARIDNFGRRISVVESPSALLDYIPNLLVALLPFDVMAIWDIPEKDLRLFMPHDWNQLQTETATSHVRQILARQTQVPELPKTTVRMEFDPGNFKSPTGYLQYHLIARVGGLRGLLAIFRIGDLPYERYDAKLFDLASNLITAALRNARLFDRLEEQTRKIIMKNRELLAANRLKTNFIANTSHELKTPLHSILGLTELLGEADSDEELARMADRIGINARRLLEIVNDLLDYSRLISDKEQVYYEHMEIRTVIGEVVDSVIDLARVKGLAVNITIPDEIEDIYNDREKLFRILTNLLNNAIKFTNVGEVNLMVQANEEHILFIVSDTGIGIPPEQMDKIFEQFHRVKGPLQNASEGTGLGLTIAQGLAKLLGGSIKVESTVNIGSTFTLQLPGAVPVDDRVSTLALPDANEGA